MKNSEIYSAADHAQFIGIDAVNLIARRFRENK
jgi:hypothetical protein